jgi:hypothetical protein
MKLVFSASGHHFLVSASLFTGLERVFCDEVLVSKKRSFLYLTPHVFELDEAGESVPYELNVLTGWLGTDLGFILRRKGIVVSSKP